MNEVHRFRMAMAKHLGRIVTPEVAAAIEAEAFHVPDRSLDPAQFPVGRCGSVTFQAERLSLIVDEMEQLHRAHWDETEGYRHEQDLDPDIDAMLAEERAGTMVQFTARRAGRLVGSFRLYLRVSRHNRAKLAEEDTLFLLPECRAGRCAMRFLHYARDCLRPLGYREFRATTKTRSRTSRGAARLLKFCGFRPEGIQWVLIEPKEPDHVF